MVWKEVPNTVEDIDPEDQIVWAMDDGWDDTHPWCAVKASCSSWRPNF